MIFKRLSRGFTLVEAAIAIAIISVVISIALPSLSTMYMTSNEKAVVEAMRSVVHACESYQMNTRQGYPDTLDQLVTANPPYLDNRFRSMYTAGNVWKGYRWAYNSPPGGVVLATQAGNLFYPTLDTFTLRADPMIRGVTGQRSFFVDESGSVRFDPNAPATVNSTAIEQAEN